jgi:hypothetical protein
VEVVDCQADHGRLATRVTLALEGIRANVMIRTAAIVVLLISFGMALL